LTVDARAPPRPIRHAIYIFSRGSFLKTDAQLLDEITASMADAWAIGTRRMKTNAQLLADITAAMADAWLAACNRRVIVTSMHSKHVVIDLQGDVSLFGPASPEECRVFIHRAAALDVLRMLGTERVAGAAMVAGGNIPVTLDG
jgi:hypothetical protein